MEQCMGLAVLYWDDTRQTWCTRVLANPQWRTAATLYIKEMSPKLPIADGSPGRMTRCSGMYRVQACTVSHREPCLITTLAQSHSWRFRSGYSLVESSEHACGAAFNVHKTPEDRKRHRLCWRWGNGVTQCTSCTRRHHQKQGDRNGTGFGITIRVP